MFDSAALFSDWRRPTFISSLNPGALGFERALKGMHPRIELVEIRLDGAWESAGTFLGQSQDFTRAQEIIRRARELSSRPVLATFRTEGSTVKINTSAYESLCRALGGVAQYVDIESNYPLRKRDFGADPQGRELEEAEKPLRDLVSDLHVSGSKVVLSRHFWLPEETPLEAKTILDMFRHQADLGADVAKLAFTPGDTAAAAVLSKAGEMAYQLVHRPTILIGMGELGQPTRLAGPQAGNWGTFVLAGGEPSAPGQLPLAALEMRYPTAN